MEKVGLVLEGGGMRGLYTAGVLEYFLEKSLFFPYTIGVSAGACMAASYISKQHGRNMKVNVDLVQDPRYLSYRNFISKRELFGMDFLFNEIPNHIVPFDFDTFLKTKEEFIVVTTDSETGQAVYYNKRNHGKEILKIIRASSSLPFIAPVVEYDNKKLLDGGISDPIPIKKSQEEGFLRNVVIMTKAEGFSRRKSKFSYFYKKLFDKRYPGISDLLNNRYHHYNNILMYLKEEQQKGNVFLIQPSIDVPVSRIERNQKKLRDLYSTGYYDAKEQYENLLEWIN